MDTTPRLKLNTRLLPALLALIAVMQLIAPYRGWLILLTGLGGAWLISFIWAWSLSRTLTLAREMRFGWAQVGDHLEERFTLTNTGLIPALWVEITDHSTLPDYQPGRVTGLGSNSHNRWYTTGICSRRGVYTVGPTTVQTGDPFGLYTVTLTYPQTAPLTVMPPIVPLPAIQVAPGGRAGEGRARPNTFERTVSVNGIRPYLPGDSLNWIHWPTSVRHNALYVRQFDSTPAGDWWLVLDLHQRVHVGQGFNTTEEHSVILTASLADRALQNSRAVGLLAHGQSPVWLPPKNDSGQRQAILRALAVARPGPHSLAQVLAGAFAGAGHIASLVIITPDTTAAWIPALWPLLHRGAAATVLLLDPLSFGGTGQAAGVQTMLHNMGAACHLITRDLLDRPEAQPGQRGHWQWRVTPTGRAVAVRRPRSLLWRGLG
jgi:uncharacterized protein (DUF58 family)